jgi:hypothetical protein
MTNAPYLAGSNSHAAGGSTTLTTTVSANVANNDSILVMVLANVASVTVTVGPDSQGNVYTQTASQTSQATVQQFIWECDGANPLTSGVDTIPVTYSANTSVQAVVIVGDNNVTAHDKTNNGSSSASTAVTTNASGVLSQAQEHALMFVVDAQAGGVPTYAAPWSSHVLTNLDANGTGPRLSVAYQVVNATTSLTGTATIVSAAWSAIILTMEMAIVSATPTFTNGVQHDGYFAQLTGTEAGGTGPYTWTLSSGSLPTGVSISNSLGIYSLFGSNPSASGTFNFVLQVTDVNGQSGLVPGTIIMRPSGASATATMALHSNLLSRNDSDFSSASLGTWNANTNVSSPSFTSNTSLVGTGSMLWYSTGTGLSIMQTGFYNVQPNKGYIASGYLLPAINTDVMNIGLAWYTSGGTLIQTDWGGPVAGGFQLAAWYNSPAAAWQPVYIADTSPSNAAKVRIVVQGPGTTPGGDQYHGQLFYLTQSDSQVLVDWNNGTSGTGSAGGEAFMDVSPFVRMDQGISLARGRQDSISEIQAGSGSFQLQNDNGYFTRFKSGSIVSALLGDVTLQRRCQINLTDENGVWHTRADGPLSQLSYTFDNTGNTGILQVSTTDVLAPLNREDSLTCWTREQVLLNGPLYHWALNDVGTSGGTGIAAESSGNNGPPLRLHNSDGTNVATIAWNDTTAGVETLADAIAPGSTSDGSEYWPDGSATPTSFLRGFDAGVTGPITSPLGNVRLVPVTTANPSHANQFTGNKGYSLRTRLADDDTINTNVVGNDWTAEAFFMPDPFIAAHNTSASNFGPYVIFTLSDSGSGYNLMASVQETNTAGVLNIVISYYKQPPSFSGANFTSNLAPTPIHSLTLSYTPDVTNGMPHHIALQIQGAVTGGAVTAYMDGNQVGTTFALNLNQTFDTMVVGADSGIGGCFYGNISCVSIYNYLLSPHQIVQDARLGQYGMWEATSDDCIARLGLYASIPAYWNNLNEQDLGLSLVEYYDVSGTNALGAMNNFEQAEQGLIFVDATGNVNFHTRDWRMGYGAPDLLLPPDTFDATMGYEVLDQFMVNEQGVASAVFSTGTGYVNVAAQAEYGTYATSTAASPVQLPIISWSRAYAQLGLSPFVFWTTPNMDDFSAWAANARSDPWLLPGQLTIDLKTLSKASTGIGISTLYALEIDNMIAPSGTLPANFPDQAISREWFIEGINETITHAARSIQFYTSPAEAQRAWRLGDSTYGVLGSTTRVGVSAMDLSTPIADGKDVQHDGGGPYNTPNFANTALNNPAANGHSYVGANDIRGLTANARLITNPPMWCVGAVATTQGFGSGQFVNTHVFFDNLYIDSEGGMGAIPAWPNWYVVTVPGYYDLDGVVNWGAQTVTGAVNQGLFLVAQAAAQGVAAGTRSPTANLAYVCPIGSQVPSFSNTGAFPSNNVSTRMYLGVGDMIALAAAQDTGVTFNTSTNWGGSMFSGVWRGFAANDDRVQLNSTTAGGTVTGGGGGGGGNSPVITTKTYTNLNTYAYYGNQANYNRRNSNGNCYVGDPQGGIGSESSQISWPVSTMIADLAAHGPKITSVFLTFHCLHTWYGAGGAMKMGTGKNGLGGSTFNIVNSGGQNGLTQIAVKVGTITQSLGSNFITCFTSGGMTYYSLGYPNDTNLSDYGYYSGGPGSWSLKVTYST